jgi:TRAP transporter 4TM/12TM fusion protein
MKKNGFRSETAAAVEAVASTGGQLTPPVMGVAIFVMAGFLGINYQSLILKTLVPALVFYVAVTAGICILANRDDIPVILRKANKKFLLTRLPVFLLPTCTLFIMLFLKFSIGFATFWAIVCLIFVAGIQKQTRPGVKALLENLTKAAVMAAGFGIACACIGIFIKCLTLSGAATKLAIMVEYVSDGRLLPLLLFTMALSVLLSSSLPTVAAYIIVAFFCAPVLVTTGIPTVRAHLFVFYFAVLAGVIPPIAGTAIVAAKIADADYVKTAWESFKLALPFFPLPFFLVKNPVFLLENQPFSEAVPAIAALITASASLVCFSGKFCLAPNRKADHVLLLFIAFSGIFYGLYHIFIWLAVSVILMGIYLTIQKKRKKLQHNPHKTL